MTPIFLVLAASATMPQTADRAPSDLRCMVASQLLIARATTPTLQQEARMMMIYFLGRVDTEVSEADLPAKLSEMLKNTSKALLASEAPRCAGELQSAGQRLHALAAKLKAQGE